MKRFCYLLLTIVFMLNTIPSKSFAEKITDVKKEMIYRILIDRFNNGNPKNDKDTDPNNLNKSQGGDLEGITNKLDYIKEFGYTAISLSPFFENDTKSYDGFSVTDFKKIDPRFGTVKDLKKLIKEAHKRDMKVIVDFVTNNPVENEDEVIDLGKWWMDQADFDGYYVQGVNHDDASLWENFNKEMKNKKSDFLLLANISENDIETYQNKGFDAINNYPLVSGLSDTFASQNQALTDVNNEIKEFVKQSNSTSLINYVDDEMTERFVSIAQNNGQYPPSRLKMALVYLFSTPGIPMNFYGTEIAVGGEKIPENRPSMDFRTDKDFSEYIRKLTELRSTLPSLTNGDFEVLHDKKGMTLFKRTYKDETTIIAINNTSYDQKVHLDFDVVKDKYELRGLQNDDLVRPSKEGFDLVLKRESSNIYAIAPKTGLNIGVIIAIPSIFIGFIIFLWAAKRRQSKMNEK